MCHLTENCMQKWLVRSKVPPCSPRPYAPGLAFESVQPWECVAFRGLMGSKNCLCSLGEIDPCEDGLG